MTLATPTIHYGRPSGINKVGTVVATSGLKVDEYGMEGPYRQTVFTFTDYALTIEGTADDGDSFVGAKIYDFPQGVLSIHGGSFYGTLTTTSTLTSTLNASKAVQIGFGTITAVTTTSNVLDAGCYNVLPGNAIGYTPGAPGVPILPTFTSSATINVASAAITAWCSQLTAITVLTDSTGRTGSTDSTIANLADLSTYANDAAANEQNLSDLAQKINELIYAVNGRGSAVKTIDGSATAADLYINLHVATDGDIDADATVTVNGTLTLEWSVSGGWAFPAA